MSFLLQRHFTINSVLTKIFASDIRRFAKCSFGIISRREKDTKYRPHGLYIGAWFSYRTASERNLRLPRLPWPEICDRFMIWPQVGQTLQRNNCSRAKSTTKKAETLPAKQNFSLLIWDRSLKFMLQHPTMWFDWKQSKYPSKEHFVWRSNNYCETWCNKTLYAKWNFLLIVISYLNFSLTSNWMSEV